MHAWKVKKKLKINFILFSFTSKPQIFMLANSDADIKQNFYSNKIRFFQFFYSVQIYLK